MAHIEPSSHEPSNKRQKHNPSIFSRYSFVTPILAADYLSDKDVLTSLLLINKAICLDLKGYCVKRPIKQSDLLRVMSATRHLPLRVRCILAESLPIVLHVPDYSWKEVEFAAKFNQLIPTGAIPALFTHLVLGVSFNRHLQIGVIPTSVTHLTFGQRVKQHKPEVFHHSWMPLYTYTYDSCFNQDLPPGVIPDSVTNLTFGRDFNQPLAVGSIPASVTKLTFGHDFDQPIEAGAMPPSVTSLEFGYEFNQHIPAGVLPASLLHLAFGDCFNKHIDVGVIPQTVTYLSFGKWFTQPIQAGVIPASVTRLSFARKHRHSTNSIPASVTHVNYESDSGESDSESE